MDCQKKRPRRPMPDGGDGDGDGDGGDRPRQLKRWRSVISLAWQGEILRRFLERCVRRVVREELERKLAGIMQPVPWLLNTRNDNTRYQLQFRSNLPENLYTFDRMRIEVAIVDIVQEEIVKSGCLSTVKVGISVLHGDFDDISWTENDVARERDGKEPLLKGEKVTKLKDGVGYFDISITDNSKWARKHKFRLGVKLNTTEGAQLEVRGGISKPILVKDRRGKYNKSKKFSSITHNDMELEATVADKIPRLLQTEAGLVAGTRSFALKDEAMVLKGLLQQPHLAIATEVDYLLPLEGDFDEQGWHQAHHSLVKGYEGYNFLQCCPSSSFDPSSSLGNAQIPRTFDSGEPPKTTTVVMKQLDYPLQHSSYVETNQLTGTIITDVEPPILLGEDVDALISEYLKKSKWFKLLPKLVFLASMLAITKRRCTSLLKQREGAPVNQVQVILSGSGV